MVLLDAVSQALRHIIIQLLFIHEEQDSQGHLSKEDNQQQDKERHKQALILLDGAHTTQECNHHDNGAHDDKHIAQCEGEEQPEVVVDQEIDPKAQNAAATEPKKQVEEKQNVLQQLQATHAHAGKSLLFCRHFSSVP